MLNIEKFKNIILNNRDVRLTCCVNELSRGTCLSDCKDCKKNAMEWLLGEYKEQILDDVEKKYLSEVIRPFRSRVKHIVKLETDNCSRQYVFISLHGNEGIAFPYFKANTMYTGMDLWHNYTLEELGL